MNPLNPHACQGVSKGHHNPRPKGLSPPERSEHNPSTQPAAEPRPFFTICGEAATTPSEPFESKRFFFIARKEHKPHGSYSLTR